MPRDERRAAPPDTRQSPQFVAADGDAGGRPHHSGLDRSVGVDPRREAEWHREELPQVARVELAFGDEPRRPCGDAVQLTVADVPAEQFASKLPVTN